MLTKIVVSTNSTFRKLRQASVPFQHLTLRSEYNSINAEMILANINDDYLGSAPDLGAYKHGTALPYYGSLDNTVVPADTGPLTSIVVAEERQLL